MGWFYDRPDVPECYGHEGFVVALTDDRASGLFREIQSESATYEPEAIARIQAGCACGWRSAYLVPERGEYHGANSVHRLPRWTPCSPWVTGRDEERCEALWAEHVHQAVPALAGKASHEEPARC